MNNSGTPVSAQSPHIALFLPDLRVGGAEHMMATLASNFSRRGFHTEIILVKAVGEFITRIPADVNLINLNSASSYSCLPALVACLRKHQPDVMISALDLTNLMAIIARQMAGYPNKLFIRLDNTQSIVYRSGFKKKLEKLLLRNLYPSSDAIIAVSTGVADDFLRYTKIPSHPIHTIYNPIITKEILAKAAQPIHHDWFSPGQPPVILGVGRLSAQKNFALLIRTVAKVLQTRRVHLLILGEGPQRAQLEALTRELKIEEAVLLPGVQSNPYNFMANSSMYVLSSDYEGLPTTLVEALACGCPVISTDCHSGPREILDGGQYGRLVPVGDVAAMAEAILKVLDGDYPPVVPAWLNQFTEETVVDRYLALMGLTQEQNN